MRLYGPLVYSWCRRAGLGAEDAGDVSQDVFATVSTKLHQFRRERPGDSFRRWLKTVTFNRARDHQRRQANRPQARGGTAAQMQLAGVPDAEPAALDESPDEQQQEANHLLRQATKLVRGDFEERTWKAFWQTVVEGRATSDVAADLGLSANAVRIARSRVRSRLREELEGLLEE